MKEILQINAVRVGLVLFAALMVIIYFNPPHTACQSQVEIYQEGIKPLWKPLIGAIGLCREHTDLGGCTAFIEVLHKLENKYDEVGHQCQPALKGDASTRTWITSSMEIFVKSAWGSVPPTNSAARNGWLDIAQIVEYCKLRQHLQDVFGKEALDEFVESRLSDLPGAQTLGRNETWNRSILSDSCNYPL